MSKAKAILGIEDTKEVKSRDPQQSLTRWLGK